MNFDFDFEKIKKQVVQTAEKAKKVSVNVVEATKYKFKLSEIKSSIEKKYSEIGKLVYESEPGTSITEKIQQLCDEITALKSSASDIRDTIDDLTNKRRCPYCNGSVDKGFDFCPKCGKQFEEE